jgi:hypothetical protein
MGRLRPFEPRAGLTEDRPVEDCTVHIDRADERSDLFRAIQRAVLKDWLGIDAV